MTSFLTLEFRFQLLQIFQSTKLVETRKQNNNKKWGVNMGQISSSLEKVLSLPEKEHSEIICIIQSHRWRLGNSEHCLHESRRIARQGNFQLKQEDLIRLFPDLSSQECQTIFSQFQPIQTPRGGVGVNMLELVSAFIVLLTQENLVDRAKLLFRAFDFDGSGELELDEVTILLSSVVRGLEIVVGQRGNVSIEELERIVYTAFVQADTNNSHSVCCDEFLQWISKSSSQLSYLNRSFDSSNSLDETMRGLISNIASSFASQCINQSLEKYQIWIFSKDRVNRWIEDSLPKAIETVTINLRREELERLMASSAGVEHKHLVQHNLESLETIMQLSKQKSQHNLYMLQEGEDTEEEEKE